MGGIMRVQSAEQTAFLLYEWPKNKNKKNLQGRRCRGISLIQSKEPTREILDLHTINNLGI